MSVTLDVNVLVYASNERDVVHTSAQALLARLAAGPGLVYLFWPAVMGYLRIVTHPTILERPLAPATAIENMTRLLARPHIRAAGEGERFWSLYQSEGGKARGNAVADTQLVALMREHGVATIYTRDRGFRRFDGITVRDPLG